VSGGNANSAKVAILICLRIRLYSSHSRQSSGVCTRDYTPPSLEMNPSTARNMIIHGVEPFGKKFNVAQLGRALGAYH
jgi:hypothetical protein